MQDFSKIKPFFLGMSRQSKRRAMLWSDFVVYAAVVLFVSWFLYGGRFSAHQYALIAGTAVTLGLGFGWFMGVYNTVVRYIGLEFFHRANVSVASTAILTALAAQPLGIPIDVLKWALMVWALLVTYVCYSRYLIRGFLRGKKSRSQREKVVIYGAGLSGAQLVNCLQQNGSMSPVAFVDDDESVQGKTVKGVQVYPVDDLAAIIPEMGVDRILLAVPSVSLQRRRQIIEHLEKFPVHIQTVPDFHELVSGDAQIDDIREVPLADLIGRTPVPANPELLHACIRGKTVLVTGAGGSIGSELCHQIARLGVKRLLMLEIAEPSLYRIEKEVRDLVAQEHLDVEIVPLLGSVCDGSKIRRVLTTYNVQTIYHAAAYKHVPIVEHNLIEGIRNNAIGTYSLALAASDAGVESFVLISTDKAVRPTSVMGASKRVAELVLQAMQNNCGTTRYSMVRFGNVLDSSGSVVPLFREQIRRGGPITVTHREIVRYFMTIPEAAELVIQAGSMAQGGDVFVLDMGEPLKIFELARRMVTLAGLTIRDESNPNGDIAIQITGLRPGEKLYEELLVGSNAFGTEHPRILRAMESCIPFAELKLLLAKLEVALDQGDCAAARNLLLQMVDSYKPELAINDLVWQESESAKRRAGGSDDKVARISPYLKDTPAGAKPGRRDLN